MIPCAVPTPNSLDPAIITWLRCDSCLHGYFVDSIPDFRPCPACASGQLIPVGLWDLRTEAAPPGMLLRMETSL